MADKKVKQSKEQRLAAQLRANLQRRKQQARARRQGEGDQRDEGLKAAKNTDKK